ncbi:putative anti-sigma regulatory factor, serine/threonine protein kinase [Candidatus Sulfopaludibacter sp. SbA3]|nr:putative anti-sigma regulatory factor, serine/threonine protein kinase [Candidatus Sulfopaludibacter sp. SbA3]
MPKLERVFTLKVPSSTEHLVMIRDFVTSIGEQAGLTHNEVGQLELAVDEACANVMEHAYGRDMTKEVSVRATIDGDTVEIVVIDTGQGFDPAAIEQLELDKLIYNRKSGGLGMRLMKTLMDEVHYEMIPGKKNELRMIKRLHK